MIVWTVAVNSCEDAIQYRKGMGTDTTHCRVGTQGMTHSTKWAAVWAIRRPAHDGQNPRRLQLKGSSSSFWHVSQPSRRKPWVRWRLVLALTRRDARPRLSGWPWSS